MEPTPKIFQTGAMKMERGLYGVDGSTQSEGWGDISTSQDLGELDAFPWLTFGNSLDIQTEEDNSVTTKAFETTPRLVGKMVENPLSFYGRFKGLNRFYYWLFGFENEPKPTVAFKAGENPFSDDDLAIGDTYTDVDTNDYTYLRTEKIRSEMGGDSYIYVFAATDGVAPALQTGEMTNGEETFDFTSHSGLMYEHLYEIDSRGRRYRSYTTEELAVVTDIVADDKRNLMCTLGKRMANYDFKYPNAMAKNFSYKATAGALSQWEFNFMAFTEQRGSYNSDTWTLLDGLCDGSLVPAHYEHRFYLGQTITMDKGAITGLSELGMTDVTISVDTPLQSIQDFVSGLSIAEPVLEGKYKIGVNGTISRHTVSTWQEMRDNQTKLVAHLYAHQGWYMQEFLVKECTVPTAGPGEGEVAEEALELKVGFVCNSDDNQFSDWLEDNTEIHSSPLVFRVRDYSPQNEMVKL